MSQEITVREAIKLTGYSRQQIYNLIIQGSVISRRATALQNRRYEGFEYRIDRQSLLDYRKKRGRK